MVFPHASIELFWANFAEPNKPTLFSQATRAQILLKKDTNGPSWKDCEIAGAFDCRVRTVEEVRKRLVERWFDEALNGANIEKPAPKLFDGKQYVQLIAMRLGRPLAGYARAINHPPVLQTRQK